MMHCEHPLRRGMRTLGSEHWAASSITVTQNSVVSMDGWPAPERVVKTMWAPSMRDDSMRRRWSGASVRRVVWRVYRPCAWSSWSSRRVSLSV